VKKNAHTLQREATKTEENGYVFVTHIAGPQLAVDCNVGIDPLQAHCANCLASRKGVEGETSIVVDDGGE
jgi:hypothetical protein